MKSKVNEIAISYSGSLKANLLPKITCSQSAADIAYSEWNKDNIELHETFKIMLLISLKLKYLDLDKVHF